MVHGVIQSEEAPLNPTRASVALGKRFGPKRSGGQKRCSERTGIGQSRLSRIASGELMPRADEAALLERDEAIPVAWWGEPPLPEDESGAHPKSDPPPAPDAEPAAPPKSSPRASEAPELDASGTDPFGGRS